MQKERLEEMKRKFDNYLQRFPDPESGSLITLDNFKEYILNPDNKDILDYIFGHCPRFCVNRKLEDSSIKLESSSFLFTQNRGQCPFLRNQILPTEISIYRNSFLQGISRTKFVDV